MEFIILVLAGWRIANLLTDPREMGPFEVLSKLRSKVGVKFDQYSQPYGTNTLSEVFACIWCMSIWVGVIITLLYSLSSTWAMLCVGFPFGIAGGIVLTNRAVKGI